MKPSYFRVAPDEASLVPSPDLFLGDPSSGVDCGWISTMRALIRQYSAPGARVLDPFAGWGTTLVACAQEGRDGVGLEIEPARVRAATERLKSFSNVEMIQADARNPPIESDSIDLVLSSIPYFGPWLHRSWDGEHQLYAQTEYRSYLKLLEEVVIATKRVLRDGAPIVLCAENVTLPGSDVAPVAWDTGAIVARHFRLRPERIICYERARSPSKIGDFDDTNRAHEYVIVGRKALS